MASKGDGAPMGRGAGSLVSAAFAGYLQSHPNWATEHPAVAKWLYIAALVSAIYLLVSFVLRWKWGRWLFGVLHTEAVQHPALDNGAIGEWAAFPDSAPRLYVSLKEPGEVPDHPLDTRLVLSNRGKEPAHKVEVAELQLRTGNIKFDGTIGVLAPNETVEVPPSCTGFGPLFMRDVVRALEHEWKTFADQLTREKFSTPMSVTYSDFQGTRFETRCELVFNGMAHAIRSIGGTHARIVEFHNFIFRKVSILSQRIGAFTGGE